MKTERILFAVFNVSLLMKLFQIPGGNIVMILALSTASIIYCPLAFYFFPTGELKQQNLAISVIAGLFLSIGIMGVLFKVMRWPGASIIQYASFPLIGLLAIVFEMRKTAKEELDNYYKNMIIRVSVVLFFAIAVFIMPKPVLSYLLPTREETLRENYLKDTSDTDARDKYERFINRNSN